jgi:Uma2 family endonuclease
MVNQLITEQVLATGITFETYLEQFADQHAEWVRGAVIDVSPSTSRHALLGSYLLILLQAYFEQRPIGKVIPAPFGMKLAAVPAQREPDLQVILKTNPHQESESFLHGAADLCIEIVSDESIHRDYVTKLQEYEKGGVGEYWIIDPLKQVCLFYRRNDRGKFEPQFADEQGSYRTPQLPGLRLHINTLWSDPFPGPLAISQAVIQMLKQN